jgi:hypothetical protein
LPDEQGSPKVDNSNGSDAIDVNKSLVTEKIAVTETATTDATNSNHEKNQASNTSNTSNTEDNSDSSSSQGIDGKQQVGSATDAIDVDSNDHSKNIQTSDIVNDTVKVPDSDPLEKSDTEHQASNTSYTSDATTIVPIKNGEQLSTSGNQQQSFIMSEDYQAYVARQKAIYDAIETSNNSNNTNSVAISDVVSGHDNTPGGSSKIDPGSDINLTQEQIAWRIFRALEDVVRQSDPFMDGAVSHARIVVDMKPKLKEVYVQGKGWAYRRNEMMCFLTVVVVGLAVQLLYNPNKSYLLVKD